MTEKVPRESFTNGFTLSVVGTPIFIPQTHSVEQLRRELLYEGLTFRCMRRPGAARGGKSAGESTVQGAAAGSEGPCELPCPAARREPARAAHRYPAPPG